MCALFSGRKLSNKDCKVDRYELKGGTVSDPLDSATGTTTTTISSPTANTAETVATTTAAPAPAPPPAPDTSTAPTSTDTPVSPTVSPTDAAAAPAPTPTDTAPATPTTGSVDSSATAASTTDTATVIHPTTASVDPSTTPATAPTDGVTSSPVPGDSLDPSSTSSVISTPDAVHSTASGLAGTDGSALTSGPGPAGMLSSVVPSTDLSALPAPDPTSLTPIGDTSQVVPGATDTAALLSTTPVIHTDPSTLAILDPSAPAIGPLDAVASALRATAETAADPVQAAAVITTQPAVDTVNH